MKKLLLFLTLFCSLNVSFGQFDFDPGAIIDKLFGPIDSDRPGQAMSPTTAGIIAIQLQTGYSYSQYNIDKIEKYQHSFVPTQLRFGLTKKWELNTSFSYMNEQFMDTLVDVRTSGFRSPEIGIRYAFLKGDGWKPYMALQSSASILSHKGDYTQNQWGSVFTLATSNRWDVVSFNTNFGVRFLGDGNMQPVFPWVGNFGFNMGKKWTSFVEGFGDFRDGSISADAGITYTPINSLQIDLFGGMYDLTSGNNQWFAELGVSYRFSFLKMIAKKKAKEFMNGMFSQ